MTQGNSRMKIESIDIETTIEKARALIGEDDHMSAATKSMFEVLILLISLLANRLNLNSSNSSKPPSCDPNRIKQPKRKTGKKPSGQKDMSAPLPKRLMILIKSNRSKPIAASCRTVDTIQKIDQTRLNWVPGTNSPLKKGQKGSDKKIKVSKFVGAVERFRKQDPQIYGKWTGCIFQQLGWKRYQNDKSSTEDIRMLSFHRRCPNLLSHTKLFIDLSKARRQIKSGFGVVVQWQVAWFFDVNSSLSVKYAE